MSKIPYKIIKMTVNLMKKNNIKTIINNHLMKKKIS